jgi:hypothetical protein
MRTFFLSLCGILLLATPARAADARVWIDGSAVAGRLVVSVRMEPLQPVNAVEGQVLYDDSLLEVEAVNDSGSPVTLWIEHPHATESGTLSFAGAMPGGITSGLSKDFTLFTVSFRVKAAGAATVSLSNVLMYLHQPDAQRASVAQSGATFRVSSGAQNASYAAGDRTPPQAFTISVYSAPGEGGATRFAAFSTTDKESGIARYEIRERWLGMGGSWRSAESPTALADDLLLSIIDVRAIDNAGNSTSARAIPGRVWATWITAIVFTCLLVVWRLKR